MPQINFWSELSKASNRIKCRCPDGVTRTATLTGPADSFYSISARVQACGKTITGWVGFESGYGLESCYWYFRPNKNSKNANLVMK